MSRTSEQPAVEQTAPGPDDARTKRRVLWRGAGIGLLALVVGAALARPWSRDGGEIVYTKYVYDGATVVGGEFRAIDLRSGRDRLLARGFPQCDAPEVFSPGGALLAYCENGGTTVLDLATGARRRHAFVDFPVAWRPGGGLVGMRQGDHPAVLELVDGAWQEVHKPGEGQIYPPLVWITPHLFAFVRCAVDSCTSAEMNVVWIRPGGAEVIDREARAWPLAGLRGARLLYSYHLNPSAPPRLAVLETRPVASRPTGVRGGFEAVPDASGERAVLLGRPEGDGAYGIYLLDEKGRTRRLARTRGESRMAWLPDGRRIAYSFDGAIRVVDLQGRQRVVARPGGDVRVLSAFTQDEAIRRSR